jgi:hypothetical protein
MDKHYQLVQAAASVTEAKTCVKNCRQNRDGNFCVKPSVIEKLKIEQLKFTDIFSGPEPVFEVSKRAKGVGQNYQVQIFS